MRTLFSKPLADIRDKSRKLSDMDDAWSGGIHKAVAALEGCLPRPWCCVCRAALEHAPTFIHRGQSYKRCGECGHVMIGCLPPEGYPHSGQGGLAYSAVYEKQGDAATAKRRSLVYQPKLEWVLSQADLLGMTRQSLLDARWVELGCGDGQFLKCLEEAGASRFTGFEADPALVGRAEAALTAGSAVHSRIPLSDVVRATQADIFAAFFVLEHIPDVHDFFTAFSDKPQGTVLAFSVPVFSLATALESAFDVHAPRNLDSVLHTQLFTEASIRRCMEIGGLEPVSQWIFGQDAADLRRMLMQALARVYPEQMLQEVDERLALMEEGLQNVVDRACFCDARHIVAVRRERGRNAHRRNSLSQAPHGREARGAA